jgi:DNA ligase-1
MIIKEFPTLKKVNSRGKTQEWKIWVEQDGLDYVMVTQHGQEGGKTQETGVVVSEGKNLGKANETSPREQAILEAESKWRKQQDKAYSLEAKIENKLLLPMLAKSFDKDGHKIVYPCLVQPKLDGQRCLAHLKGGKVELLSRRGKTIDVIPHINNFLLPILLSNPTYVFDGELYLHKKNFQELISLVKRDDAKEGSETVEYHIYDLFDHNRPELTYISRRKIYENLLGEATHIKVVDEWVIESSDEVMEYHSKITGMGYEGAILRNMNGLYKQDKRSEDLQKVKSFLEEEFECVGADEGKGKFEGMAIFRLKTKEGKEFSAMPLGTEHERRKMWKERNKYVGEQATIKFFEYSKDGVPRFPILKIFRTYE